MTSVSKRIEDYAIIGDCETAALVSRDGSIDWLCWPRFDSGAVFAALVGRPDNGHWTIAATESKARLSRRYCDKTLILETDIETDDGAVTLIDFMPLKPRGSSNLVRLVRGRRGRVEMTTEFVIRFDYGSIVPWVTQLDGNGLKAVAGPDMVVLRTRVPLQPSDHVHRGTFSVQAGETVDFVLGYGHSHKAVPKPIDPLHALDVTQGAWEKWSKQYKPNSQYAPAVLRSLLTLKALTYHATGGITAAITTSLPETLGGTRNWDYRYCWLRDATFTLLALLNSGFSREADSWRGWLRRAVAGDPAQVQIMYGLAGERRLDEWEAPWLAGYEDSRTGTHRQCRGRPAAARHLWRGTGRAFPGQSQRAFDRACGMGRASKDDRALGVRLARTG